jgi:hypothetical protein
VGKGALAPCPPFIRNANAMSCERMVGTLRFAHPYGWIASSQELLAMTAPTKKPAAGDPAAGCFAKANQARITARGRQEV